MYSSFSVEDLKSNSPFFFKAELLYGKKLLKLKEGSIPTIFIYAKSVKRRISSINRQEKSVKRACLEEVLEESQEHESECCEKKPVMVDKEIDNCVKTKSVRTQYKKTDILEEDTSIGRPVLVKIKACHKKSRGVEVGINTELSFPCDKIIHITEEPVSFDLKENNIGHNSLDQDLSEDEGEEKNDPDFIPEKIEEEVGFDKNLPSNDAKFVVFWTSLLQLLHCCMICRQVAFIRKTVLKGSQLIVDMVCNAGHETKWHSQPNIKGFAAGNISLSASILFSGCTFQRFKDILNIAKIPFISHVSFNSIQKRFLFPSIHRVFTTNRTLLLDMIRSNNNLDLLGDGRCDSPGFSAKYGTYTIMDSFSGFILDFHISHCKMAGNSAAMELQGLKNVLRRLEDQKIKVSSLTTDRHKQVRSFLKRERKDINHQFDVWHIGRNIKKKLTKIVKKKSCIDLQPWIKSIINHFWWCCASCEGDLNDLKESWLSILYHITDRHRWKVGKAFKKCKHPKLSKEERSRKPFLSSNSQSFKALEKVVRDKHLIGALSHLTSFNHTGTLEVYHSLYNKFCPKRLHFSYAGMIARSQLAVLDHNSGVSSVHMETKKGDKRYKLQFSKVTQSWVVKSIKSPKKRDYIDHLLFEVSNMVSDKDNFETVNLKNVPSNIAPTAKPVKTDCILNKKTRFSS